MSNLKLPSSPYASPNRSPWLEQLRDRALPMPLDRNVETDVAVVGAGIAGVATAYFLLRDTRARVLLLEANRVARGATGHNAGQLVTYFERPLARLAEDFGYAKAIEAQRDLDASWQLLDLMLAESSFPHPVPRLAGQMGMFTLNHLMVHLRNNLLRRSGGLVREAICVSESAEFLRDIPREFDGLYDIVAQERVHALLGTQDARYRATLSDLKGCLNSALLCEHLVTTLQRTHPERFRLSEESPVQRLELESEAVRLRCGPHSVRASRVVLCTNGFVDLEIANRSGADVQMPTLVQGTVGFMAAYFEDVEKPASATSYLMSPRINEGQSYYYATRRPFEVDGSQRTLTCIGGPDRELAPGEIYDRSAAFPADQLAALERQVGPLLGWKPGARTFDYLFHGLMGYTPTHARIVGPEPRNAALLYNLGCNGVGLLPSIHGAWRIAQTVNGTKLPPSLFDPA